MRTLTAVTVALIATAALAQDGWMVDRPRRGVVVLRDDDGTWSDNPKLRMAHINTSQYQARKTLDLSELPEGALQHASNARVRMYFGLQDWSWNMEGREHNGLDGAFEVVVNGHPLRFETADPRFPGRAGASDPLRWEWVDVPVPVQHLQPGENEVIIRKVPGNDDDYIYPGIDNSVQLGHSRTSYDGGETWEQGLNTNDARGEFMIRLVLIEGETDRTATWRPPDELDDPGGLIAWAGRDGNAWVLEPDRDAFDGSQPMTATVRYRGPVPEVAWLDRQEQPLEDEARQEDGALVSTVPATTATPGSLTVRPAEGVTEIEIAYTRSVSAPEPGINMRPEVAAPAGRRREVEPSCTIADGVATLETAGLRAVFSTEPTLALESLHVAEVDRDVLARPEATHLFRIKVGEEVFGCRDCTVREIEPVEGGFATTLAVGDTGLTARLTAATHEDELALSLQVENQSDGPVDFYVSFPHLSGIELSQDPGDDYYLFPMYGGVIADSETLLRSCYGNNTAWWQMIDLFSPERGGGMYLRCDDPTGLLKFPALRKGIAPPVEFTWQNTTTRMREEMTWFDALEPDPGIGLCLDYARRTRASGEDFEVPAVAIGSHAGDWRPALERYVRWAREAWGTRPYPSAFTDRWYIDPTGWSGQLVDENGFTLEAIRENVDIAELMSWWKWGELGPWNTPLDQVKEQCGERFYNFRKSSFLVEPVTGRTMYTKNRGDYKYYEPWGGKDALRDYIDRIRDMGVLPTFYIEGVLACATTDVAKQHARDQAVIDPDWANPQSQHWCPKVPGDYTGQWGSYQMCSDAQFWPDYLAETVARVCRDTGIDGVRLDEYGHGGWVCYNDRHSHIFAEPGHNAWLQATQRSCRLVHEAMDEVRNGLVLMTEYPGNDHLCSTLEGALFHESSAGHVSPVRPVPCNLFRFYFRHCKPFEIARPEHELKQEWALFNATATFSGSARHRPEVHATLRENTDVFEGEAMEPLVPTLVPLVYANRFQGAGKVIWTLFNATGHTVEEPLLPVEPDADHRYINLLTGEELEPVEADGGHGLSLRMRRNTAAVIARLPRRLSVEGGRAGGEGEIVVVDGKGARLATVKPGDALPEIAEGTPVMLKLLRDGRLVDAVAWPQE